jgi:AraC-like DNA-binding protein
MSIEDIAARLGYSDAASFTRAFVRAHGVPPGKFRSTTHLRAGDT